MTLFECGLVSALGALWVAAAAGLLMLARRLERLERMTSPPDPDEVGVDKADHH